MKTIFRVLIILTVAALIGGMLYSAVNAMPASNRFEAKRFERPDGEEFHLDEEHEEREEFEGGMMLPFGMVKSLVVMSVIGAPYFLFRKFKRK